MEDYPLMKNSSPIYPTRSFRWYGFDLDGTIADNSQHNFGMGDIGKPIKPMVNLMKKLHAKGWTIKIVTARLSDVGTRKAAQRKLIEHIWRWCDHNLGFRPEITDRKDALMERLYDDRARHVVRNRGVDLGEFARSLARGLDALLETPKKNRKRAMALRDKCRRIGLI